MTGDGRTRPGDRLPDPVAAPEDRVPGWRAAAELRCSSLDRGRAEADEHEQGKDLAFVIATNLALAG